MLKENDSIDSPKEVFSVSDRLKEFGSAILSTTGLAYACGFLVINIHLSKYEIYDFSIINARYIYAGFFFLLLCFLALFAGVQIEKTFSRNDSSWFNKIFGLLTIWLFLSSVFGLSIKALLASIEGMGAFLSFPISFWFYPAILFFFLQALVVKQFLSKESFTFFPVALRLSISFVPFVSLAVLYALFFYPLWPVSLAGGRPVPIQFLVEEKNMSLIDDFIQIDVNTSNISEIVYLIEKGSNSYYVLVQNQQQDNSYQPVEIDKSLIAGVLHTPINVNLPF